MINEYSSAKGDLVIQVEDSPETVIMKWIGQSTEFQPSDFLSPIFEKHIHNNQKKVVIDLCRLEYFTSPSLAPIIKLLETANEGSRKARLIYNSDYDWQVKIFDAFNVFNKPDQVFVVGDNEGVVDLD